MGFNELMVIEPTSMSALDRLDEVEQVARDHIAQRLQFRLRSTLDPGADLESAVRAQTVKVTPAGDEFSVHQEDQGAVLKPAIAAKSNSSRDPNIVTNVEQLFEMSSGVPSVQGGKLVYRTISPKVLFGQAQKAEAEQELINQTFTSAFRDELVDAYEEAFQEVQRRHPGDR